MKLWADGVDYYAVVHQNRPDLPCLLMLHGFMGSGEAFAPLIDPLSDFCNPVTIDLIGHGQTESDANPELFTAERQAAQIESVLSRLKLPNLFAFGYSMGGRLLFQLITRYPKLFQGALIESSHCGIATPQERSERAQSDEKRASEIETDMSGFLDRWQALPLFNRTPDEARNRYRAIMERQSPAHLAASLRGFGAGVMPSVCEKLHQLQMPLYLVAGEHDPKYADRMAEIARLNKRIKLHIASGAGHRVHAGRPETLLNILKTLIQTDHV
jgi:2-succinyl-6-hydroxy-2,4-cyclohexadiene-1-carboxylate synthase